MFSGESTSTSTKREAIRAVKQLTKDITTRLDRALRAVEEQNFEEDNDEEEQEAGSGRKAAEFSVCISLHRLSNLVISRDIKIPSAIHDRIHTMIEREMADPHDMTEFSAVSVAQGMQVEMMRFVWKYHEMFDMMRRELDDDMDDDEEESGKKKKKKEQRKKQEEEDQSNNNGNKSVATSASSSSSATAPENQQEQQDGEFDEYDDEDEMMNNVEETKEEAEALTALCTMRTNIISYVRRVFQNYLELTGDTRQQGDQDGREEQEEAPTVVRMRVVCEHAYKIVLDMMTLCSHRLQCENTKMRRLAYEPTTSMSRLLGHVFKSLMENVERTRDAVLQQENNAIAQKERRKNEKKAETEGKKGKKGRKAKKVETGDKISKRIAMPRGLPDKTSAIVAYEAKMVDELVLPLFRWFQFSAKYSENPNLDIGGIILRVCSTNTKNGPLQDLAKSFVKFLLDDVELTKRGEPAFIAEMNARKRQIIENMKKVEEDEENDDDDDDDEDEGDMDINDIKGSKQGSKKEAGDKHIGFKMLLSIQKLALRQEYEILQKQKLKIEQEGRKIEEFAVKLASKMGSSQLSDLRQVYLCVMLADNALFGLSSGKKDAPFLRVVGPFLRHLKSEESINTLVQVLETNTSDIKLKCTQTDPYNLFVQQMTRKIQKGIKGGKGTKKELKLGKSFMSSLDKEKAANSLKKRRRDERRKSRERKSRKTTGNSSPTGITSNITLGDLDEDNIEDYSDFEVSESSDGSDDSEHDGDEDGTGGVQQGGSKRSRRGVEDEGADGDRDDDEEDEDMEEEVDDRRSSIGSIGSVGSVGSVGSIQSSKSLNLSAIDSERSDLSGDDEDEDARVSSGPGSSMKGKGAKGVKGVKGSKVANLERAGLSRRSNKGEGSNKRRRDRAKSVASSVASLGELDEDDDEEDSPNARHASSANMSSDFNSSGVDSAPPSPQVRLKSPQKDEEPPPQAPPVQQGSKQKKKRRKR